MRDRALRILVIDDNPQDRLLVRRALLAQFDGPEVVELPDLPSLDAALQNPHIDAVITDYRLRWSDGLQVLDRVHRVARDVPVVMFTNTGSEEVAAEGLRQGLADYIIKGPTQYARVAHAVRQAVERARAKQRELDVLSREQQARRAAEEANRAKDEFLATVSHELRTPLNAITGWVHIMRDRLGDRAIAERALDAVDRNTRLLVRVVEDLMDSSRIISGKLALRTRATDAPRIVEIGVESVQAAAAAKHIAISVSSDPNMRLVSADPDRLQQIVWNLLSNAVKFTPPHGRITVRVAQDGSQVVLSVADTGKVIGNRAIRAFPA